MTTLPTLLVIDSRIGSCLLHKTLYKVVQGILACAIALDSSLCTYLTAGIQSGVGGGGVEARVKTFWAEPKSRVLASEVHESLQRQALWTELLSEVALRWHRGLRSFIMTFSRGKTSQANICSKLLSLRRHSSCSTRSACPIKAIIMCCKDTEQRRVEACLQALLPERHMCASCSLPEEDEGCPQPLLGSESLEWDAIPNLDDFFSRVYK